MSTIPAFTFGGITRPALILDPSGNIILDPAAQAFMDTYGTKALYAGCPPGTPFPPIPDLLTTPVDTNPTTNSVLENAAVNTPVGITASSNSLLPFAITYSLTGDNSGGGFKIDPHTGVVSVADHTKIDFETSPGHAYTVTVQATDGIFTTSQSFAIAVGNVNEAPTGASSTLTTNEDTAHVFTVADFGFSDPQDNPSPNALQAVHIDTVSGSGSLTNNGNPVIAGSVISAADIIAGHLKFTPAADANGASYASFTFQVQDNGGTANGGVDTDPTAKTITINVTPVNDAPSFTEGANQTLLEDAGPQTVAGFATGISAGPANEAGQTVNFLTSNDNSALFSVQPTIDATGQLTFTAAANGFGVAHVTVQAHDNGGTANGGVDTSPGQTFTITVGPVNDAPSFTVGADPTSPEDSGAQTINGFASNISDGPNETGQTLNFIVSNNNNALFSVQPSIDANGNLTYTPAANANGNATVQVQLHDNGGTANGGVDTSAVQTFHINVPAVNDAPSFTIGANQVTLEDSGAHTVNGFVTGISPGPADEAGQTVNFLVSDDNNAMFSVQPSIDASGNLTYTLAANANGSATVSVQAHDNGGTANGGVDTSAAQTFTIGATAVNDAPVGTANTLTILEDHTHAFTAAEFGFTDPVDAASASGANVFQDVIITTIPGGAAGTLTLSGGAVAAGQVIAVANIGNLVFTPAANANGSAEASFTFQVQDDGGTANGGVDTDPTPKTITFNVTPVNDAPAGTDSTISAQGAHTFIAADFGFTDPSDAAGAAGANHLLAVEITTIPASGSLTLNGSPVSAGQFVTAADIGSGLLIFTPSGNSSGSFTFQVQDDGGTANGGADLDLSPNTLTIIQNTPPVANDDSVSATEAGGLNNSVPGLNPSGNVILGTGAPGDVQDTDAQDASSALAVVAVHTGPEGGSLATGTVGVPLAGAHGTLTLNLDGSYTYLVNQTDAAVQALHTAAETITDVFNYTIQDTGGLQDTATLTITIHGADDLPQAVADTGTMTEDDAPTSFNVIANDTQDPDHTALNTIAVGPGSVTVTGPAGETFANTDATATIVSNEVQVSLNNAHFQQLALGEHATITVPYTLTGDAGETSSANLVVTVNGVNDVPVAVDDSGSITEDQVGTFTVLTNDTLDADHGAPNNVTTGAVTNLSAPGGEGITTSDIGVSVNGSNQVVVTLGSNFQHMQDGQTTTFDVPYTLHGDQAGDTSTATLHVTVNGANDAPVAANFTFNGVNSAIGNTDLVVNDPTDGAPDPAGPQVTITASLLGGATDVDGPGPLVVVAGTITTAHSGTVIMEADGDFTYKPPVGYIGSDSFTYQVSDQNAGVSGVGLGTGTVTINVASPHVWYVNADAATDGDGSSEKPFNTLSHFAGVGGVDSSGDTIVLETASAHYTGGLTLENNEQLISQSAGVTIDGTTLFTPSGANAVLDGGLVLGTGNTIEGVDFGATSGFAVSGSSVGTLHLDDTTTGLINNASGGGISIGGSSNALTVNLSSVTTGGGTNGIALTNSSGTVHVHGGTISGASSADVALSGGTVAFTDDGAINDTTGTAVSIAGMTGGTQAFTGSVTGGAVALSTNTGATINFTGGVFINTSATNGTGFSATGGGTVTVTGATNTINSGQGTALDVENTTIGSGNLTFKSITSNGGSADGIILVNTGSTGGLHVTGDGSTAASGGTIANKTGADGSSTQGTGVFLNNTHDVELAYMQLNDFSNFAIRGNSVTGFTLDHSVINGDSGTSNSLSDPLAAFANVGEDAVRFTNLLGSGSITNSTISGGYTNTIMVENNTGTLNRLTIDHSTIGGRTDNGTGMNDGINFQADSGSTAMNLTVTNSALTTARAALIAVTNQVGTNTDVVFDNNTLTNNHPLTVSGGPGLDLAGLGNMTFDVSNNTFDMHAANGGTGIKSNVIEVNKGTGSGTSTFDGTISGNTIGVAATAHSGSGIGSNDIDINSQDNGVFNVLVKNNILTHYDTAGIQISQIAGNSTVNATVTGNTTSNGDSNAFAGLYVVAGSGLVGDNGIVNLNVSGNDFSNGDPANGSDVFLQQSSPSLSTFNLYKGVSASGSPSQVVLDNNLNPATTVVATSGTIHIVSTAPPLPLLAAPGGVQASSPTTGEMHLTQSELDSVVAAAIAEWAAAGATASQLAALHAATFSIADLSGSIIGDETSPAHITIDTDAAGHGWFIDPTPSDNSEFTHAVNAAGTDLLTDPTNAAAGHLDLLTAVVHEMGHVLGLPDSNSASAVNDLMYISLVDGERRLPDSTDVAQASTTPAVPSTPAGSSAFNQSFASNASGNGAGGFGGAGADNFVFAHGNIQGPTPPVTPVFALGDKFDFSALIPQSHGSLVGDASLIQAVGGAGGFAAPQVNTVDSSLGSKAGAILVNAAPTDGTHFGDAFNALLDGHTAVQTHAGWLV